MAEPPAPRPTLTLLMGCPGAGKTAWKRSNWHRLPDRFYDERSLAGGIGSWDEPGARKRARAYVTGATDEALRKRLDFGAESIGDGSAARDLARRAAKAGYRISGIFIGTDDAAVNAARIERRVRERTGHRVDPTGIPELWRQALADLRRTAGAFDSLTLLDNSRDSGLPLLEAPLQCRLERGSVVAKADSPAWWCASWLSALAVRQKLDSMRRAQAQQAAA